MYFNDVKRTYRQLHSGLTFQTIALAQSDLHVGAPESVAGVVFERARGALYDVRKPLDAYIRTNPAFASALEPLPECEDMPPIVLEMCKAARLAGVGPMAAVAGAVNDFIAKLLLSLTEEIIIENGGDILIHTLTSRNILIYAGKSPLSGKLGINVSRGTWGVCTSSGTVGHALSFGKADAAVVLTKPGSVALANTSTDVLPTPSAEALPTALADACATALGNRISCVADIEPALGWALEIPGVCGAVAVVGGAFGAIGDVELVRI